MGNVHYRVLFEVVMLHDYYLSQADEKSFFDLNEDDKDQFLQRQLDSQEYDVHKDLVIEPTSETKRFLENHRMRLISTSTGFFVGAEVTVELNDINQEVYRLAIPVSVPVTWEFTVGIKNPDYGNFTNIPLIDPLRRKYIFSNENPGSVKNLPSLAMPVADFASGIAYEMGILSIIGGNLNQAVDQTSDPAVGWRELPANHNWINEQDRTLLPKLINYRVIDPGINQIEFELQDTSGTAILEINTDQDSTGKTKTANGDLVNVVLDFRNPQLHDASVENITDGKYNLEIKENGSSPKIQPIFISDDLYGLTGLGGIIIHSRNVGPGADILAEDSTLIRLGNNHPTFEIRLKNRHCYWRYKSRTKKGLKAENQATNFLEEFNDDLRTKEPKSLQRLPLPFENGGGVIYLPNPNKLQIRPEGDGRLYADIFVSEVEGLIGIK